MVLITVASDNFALGWCISNFVVPFLKSFSDSMVESVFHLPNINKMSEGTKVWDKQFVYETFP